MGFNVDALTNYVIQNEKLLVTKSLFDAKTQSVIQASGNVMAGVKSAETINVLDTDAIFQTGGTCGFTSSGSSTFTQRTLTVGKFKVHESLCPKTLETKYTQLALAAGSNPQAMPFEQQYTDLKSGVIAEQLETALWQGITSSADVNLNKFNGIAKLLLDSGVSVNGNTTGITVATGTFSTNITTPRVSATTSLAIATSGVDRINVDSSGNVGFGTSVPIKQLEITKSARAHIVSLTDVSTSIAINFNTAQNFAIQLVGNRTFENPSNCAAGQTGSIFIEQDVSGGKTLSFGSNWKFANGEAPTLTTTASAVDRLDYIVYTSTAVHAVVTYDVK